MVSKEEIREKGLTTDDVLDLETERPMEEVEILPEWEEDPANAPGKNVRIEGDQLVYERDGFEVRMESHQATHWRVVVSIPDYVAKWYPRDIDLKISAPENGFVDDVETEDYQAVEATLVISANFMPTWEVSGWIDDLIDRAEKSEEFHNDVAEKMSVARENEE